MPEQDVSDLHRILATQSAAGLFDSSPDFDRLVTMHRSWEAWMSSLERSLDRMFPGGNAKERAQLLATMKVLVLLNSFFAEQWPMWKRATDKAMRCVAKQLGRAVAEIESWLVKLQTETVFGG